jgi:HrpA-like RNA helicase
MLSCFIVVYILMVYSVYINNELEITNDGKLAAQSPLDPVWVYAVNLAKRHRPLCAQHIAAIAALRSSMHPIFTAPLTHQAAGHLAMDCFADPSSDHLTELNALYAYEAAEEVIEDEDELNEWCQMRFLNRRVLDDVLLVRDMCAERMGFDEGLNSFDSQARLDVRWVLARAFFRHTAFKLDEQHPRYRTVHGNIETTLAVDSMLNTGVHPWIIYDKFTMGRLPYLEKATAIDPAWIVVSYLTTVIRPIY